MKQKSHRPLSQTTRPNQSEINQKSSQTGPRPGNVEHWVSIDQFVGRLKMISPRGDSERWVTFAVLRYCRKVSHFRSFMALAKKHFHSFRNFRPRFCQRGFRALSRTHFRTRWSFLLHVSGHIFAPFAFQKLRLGLVRVQTVPYICIVP